MDIELTTIKAVPADAPKSDFAYTPGDARSAWGLYVGDAEHASLAAAALSSNPPHGNKPDIPEKELPAVRAKVKAALRKHFADDKDKLKELLDKADGGDGSTKSLIVSDDGEPWRVGDVAVCDAAYMSGGSPLPTTGGACLVIVRMINGNRATCECLDTDLKPTGMMCDCSLLNLKEYNIPGVGTDTDDNPPMKTITTLDAADYSTVVKAVGEDRIGGYLVVWGSAAQQDLTGEYFTKDTAELTSVFKQLGKLPSFYHHGGDDTLAATLAGEIDKLEPDNVGLWAEAQINKYNRYAGAIKDLVSKGVLSWSSGALPAAKRRERDGRITRWPIMEGSLTPTPAEPRNTGIAPLKAHFAAQGALETAYKAMNLPTDLLGLPDDDVQDAQDSATSPRGTVKAVGVQQPISPNEDNLMADIQLTPALIEAVAKQIKDQEAAAAAQKAVEDQRIQAAIDAGVQAELAKRTQGTPQPGNKATTLPAPQGADGGAGRIDVLRATKYSHLSASDMGFMADLMSNQKQHQLGEAFYRELADKTVKSVNAGDLPYAALETLIGKMGGTFKANELDSVGQANYGQEWAPDSWRAELWLRVRQDNVVAPLFEMIDMPTNPYELPIESSDPTVYNVPETTDQTMLVYTSANPITQSKAGTGKVQMSAKKLGLRMAWSSELNEDSLIPIVANYRRQAVRAMANGVDNVLVNGDTATGASTNVNLIDGTPTTGTKYLAFDGLRKYSLVTHTAQAKDGKGAAVTLPLLRATRFLLSGQYALQPRNLAWIVDDSTYAKLLNMPEFLTVDKIGESQATALSGLVGMVDGVGVYATAEMGLANNAGKISATPGNNTFGQAVCVFRPNWKIGYRRQVSANVEFISGFDAYHLVVTARLCLVSFSYDTQASATLYDLAV